MAEIAPAGGGGPNRLFVVIAIGLAGLLILGLIALGGIFAIRTLSPSNVAPTLKVAVTTPTRALPTATLPPTATSAPTEIPTPTLVLSAGGTGTQTPPTSAQSTTVTPTVSSGTLGTPGAAGTPVGTPGTGQLPQSGLGEDLLMLAGGVVLVMIIFAARRARTA
jgi:hypothetical protein